LDTKKLPNFNERFGSVKGREHITLMKRSVRELGGEYVAYSRVSQDNNQKTSKKLSHGFKSIKEALPAALLKKKKRALEKKTEDDQKKEASAKRLIKVKDPKEYHYGGKISNEMLTGKLGNNLAESKILQGKSYCISVSPSQKMSKISLKKKIMHHRNLIIKNTEEFKIEDQYECRAA
jgi:hypothetical protein